MNDENSHAIHAEAAQAMELGCGSASTFDAIEHLAFARSLARRDELDEAWAHVVCAELSIARATKYAPKAADLLPAVAATRGALQLAAIHGSLFKPAPATSTPAVPGRSPSS